MTAIDAADVFISNALAGVPASKQSLPAKWRRKSGRASLLPVVVKPEPVDDAFLLRVKTEEVEHNWLGKAAVVANTLAPAIDIDGEQDMDISRENTPAIITLPTSREVVLTAPPSTMSMPVPLTQIKPEPTEPAVGFSSQSPVKNPVVQDLGSGSSSTVRVTVKREIVEPPPLTRDDTLTCAFIDLTLEDDMDIFTWEKGTRTTSSLSLHAQRSAKTSMMSAMDSVEIRELSADIDFADHATYLELIENDYRPRVRPPSVVKAEPRDALIWHHKEDSLDRILFADDNVERRSARSAEIVAIAPVSLTAEQPAEESGSRFFEPKSQSFIKREPSPPIDLTTLPEETVPKVRSFGLPTPPPPSHRSSEKAQPNTEKNVQDNLRTPLTSSAPITIAARFPVKMEPAEYTLPPLLPTPPRTTTKARARRAVASKQNIGPLPSPPLSQGSPQRCTSPSPLYPLKVAGLKRKTPDDERSLPTPVSAPPASIRLDPFKSTKTKKGKLVKSAQIVIDTDDEGDGATGKPPPAASAVGRPPKVRRREEVKEAATLPQLQRAVAHSGSTKLVLKVPPSPPKPVPTVPRVEPASVVATSAVKPSLTTSESGAKRPQKRTRKSKQTGPNKPQIAASASSSSKTSAVATQTLPHDNVAIPPTFSSHPIPIIKQEEFPVQVPSAITSTGVKKEEFDALDEASALLAMQLAPWGLRRSQRIPKPRFKKELSENSRPPPVRRRRRAKTVLPAGTKEEPIEVEKIYIRIPAAKIRQIPVASAT